MNHLCFLISAAPFLRHPYRFVLSAVKSLRSKSFETKNHNNKYYGKNVRTKGFFKILILNATSKFYAKVKKKEETFWPPEAVQINKLCSTTLILSVNLPVKTDVLYPKQLYQPSGVKTTGRTLLSKFLFIFNSFVFLTLALLSTSGGYSIFWLMIFR